MTTIIFLQIEISLHLIILDKLKILNPQRIFNTKLFSTGGFDIRPLVLQTSIRNSKKNFKHASLAYLIKGKNPIDFGRGPFMPFDFPMKNLKLVIIFFSMKQKITIAASLLFFFVIFFLFFENIFKWRKRFSSSYSVSRGPSVFRSSARRELISTEIETTASFYKYAKKRWLTMLETNGSSWSVSLSNSLRTSFTWPPTPTDI